MDIVVCVKQVPVTAEAEVMVDGSGRDIKKDRLVFDVNEADNYAVEEALQLTEKYGGTITLVNLGPESADKTLRSLLAKGTHEAVRLTDEHFDESDAYATARILAAALKSLSYDLVLTGCYSSDLGYSQVGTALAELLGIPHATMVIGLEILDGKIKVERELEGGTHERLEIDLPALLTIQSGIHTPRYPALSKLLRANQYPLEVLPAATLTTPTDRQRVCAITPPERVRAGVMMEGTAESKARQLAKLLHAKGLC